MSDAETGTRPERRRLADGYAVLARCWRHPTEDLAATIQAGDLEAVAPGVEVGSLSDLRAEYARLFLGPGPAQCPPYESVYRDGDPGQAGQVLGPTTGEVVGWYREFGMGLAPDWPDLPDHVATELEFAAYLTARGEGERLERFLDDHPRAWVGDLTECVRSQDPAPFYRELAGATEQALDL